MRINTFIKNLSALNFENCFNPYAQRCKVHDYSDAPQKRRQTLRKILLAASKKQIDAIWIGRDLGFNGGRRTGLAFTDDVHLTHHKNRWQIHCDGKRATKGGKIPERSATIIWQVLEEIRSPIFLWNVFPLHPHEPGLPFTNRCHSAKERIAGEAILASLIELLHAKRIIAIGNNAEKAAAKFSGSHEVIKVRHPSYGGQTTFIEQIQSIYGLGTNT